MTVITAALPTNPTQPIMMLAIFLANSVIIDKFVMLSAISDGADVLLNDE
jgi:hypothetical protein